MKPADQAWLERFDSYWDTKAAGRSQEDALDRVGASLEPVSHLPEEAVVTAPGDVAPQIQRLMGLLERVSITRQYKSYCAFNAVLRDQTTRQLRFKSLRAANQQRRMLLEFMTLAADPPEIQQLIEDPQPSRHPISGPRDEE